MIWNEIALVYGTTRIAIVILVTRSMGYYHTRNHWFVTEITPSELDINNIEF